MKKTILIILAALAAVFAFVSCEKEEEDEPKEELKQIRYSVQGFVFPGDKEPYNIIIYEYDKSGKILARRTIDFLFHDESRTYLSELGLDNITIYFTNKDQTEFGKIIHEWIPSTIDVGFALANDISQQEYINYITNNSTSSGKELLKASFRGNASHAASIAAIFFIMEFFLLTNYSIISIFFNCFC